MRHGRLRRSEDVRAVLRRGRRVARPSVVVHVIDRGDAAPPRIAVVASRRVGTAVRRNRAKRVLRAAAERCTFPLGIDVALVGREATPDLGAGAATADLVSIMEQMFDMADQSPGVPS